jgi:hypothetical protein
VETRQDLFWRTQELAQDVIAKKAKVVDQLNENQDRLPSRALFHKDDLVFLDKYPVYPDKPSKLEPRYWGPYIVTEVLPLNAVKIRYDQGLEEIVNADRQVKYQPSMLTPLKDWKKFKKFSPKINVPTPISAPTQGSQLQDDEGEEEEHDMSEEESSEKVPSMRIPRSKIAVEDQGFKRRTQGRKPGFYSGQYYIEGGENMNRKYLVERNLRDFHSSLAADPRYFQECSSDRLVGQAEFSNSSRDREYGFIPPRLVSLEI